MNSIDALYCLARARMVKSPDMITSDGCCSCTSATHPSTTAGSVAPKWMSEMWAMVRISSYSLSPPGRGDKSLSPFRLRRGNDHPQRPFAYSVMQRRRQVHDFAVDRDRQHAALGVDAEGRQSHRLEVLRAVV